MGRLAGGRANGQPCAMDALPCLLDWLRPQLGARPFMRPFILGLAGAQGSGKSTLAAGVARALAADGRAAAAVSLDDYYLPRRDRLALAARIHPLLATRGPPGSHDVPLLMQALCQVRAGQTVALPRFDKLADDRLAPQHWHPPARIDVLVLEGWCVGARAQPTALLRASLNALEADEDPAAIWRTHANQALAGAYQRLWNRLDALAFLAAPDWETVPRWRAEQEAGLTRAAGRTGMDTAAIARFCDHYERLTRWQLATTPQIAGLTLHLDAARQVAHARPAPTGRARP